MAPLEPSDVLLPRRDWENLAALKLPDILAHLDTLTKRCAGSGQAFDDALIELEINMHIFIAKGSPSSIEEKEAYLSALGKARLASRAIFPPQQAYRLAVSTLGILVTEMIVVSSSRNPSMQDMGAKLVGSKGSADKEEEGIRELIRKIAHHTGKGLESHGLLTFLDAARQRFQNWKAEEEKLKALARQCIGAMM